LLIKKVNKPQLFNAIKKRSWNEQLR